MSELGALSAYLGQDVVVDTQSSYLYVGRLEQVDERVLVLRDVDVHDNRETSTSKDLYLIQTKKFGVKKNRLEAAVLRSQVVSVSRLADVIEY